MSRTFSSATLKNRVYVAILIITAVFVDTYPHASLVLKGRKLIESSDADLLGACIDVQMNAMMQIQYFYHEQISKPHCTEEDTFRDLHRRLNLCTCTLWVSMYHGALVLGRVLALLGVLSKLLVPVTSCPSMYLAVRWRPTTVFIFTCVASYL